MPFVSATPDGDAVAAHWRAEHCLRIRIGEGADMMTMGLNSPPAEPHEQSRPRVRETISTMLGP